jgi:hypothetical protein
MLRFTILVLCVAVCLAGGEGGKRHHGGSKEHHKRTTTTTVAPTQPNPPNPPTDASAYCFQCLSRQNQKNFYPDPLNCHNYYQCFYINSTFAVGYLRNCPSGSFWHDEVLSCLPEGAVACTDQCRDPAVSGVGVYAGSTCNQYYVCAGTASYGMCCPAGTRYNTATYLCDVDPTCTDSCSQSAPAVQTTAAPASQYNATVCIDSFGAYLSSVAGQSNAFYTIDIGTGLASDLQYCPAGVLFDLTSCRCNVEDPNATPAPYVAFRQLKLWLPFTGDAQDHSIYHFSTIMYAGAFYDASIGQLAGSLNVNGGVLSIAGLKSYEAANSWFASFLCNGACAAGALISNNKDSTSSEYTIQLYLSNSNTITVNLDFWAPANTVTLSSTFTVGSSGWTQAGVTYDGNTVRLYINGVVVASQNIGGHLAIAHCPYVVGTDQQYGAFNGNIDNVAISRYTLTAAEIASLGNLAAMRTLGLIP